MDSLNCTHCQSPIQPSWRHCPVCGAAISSRTAGQTLSEDPIRGLGAQHAPELMAELVDGGIDITPEMRKSYAREMRIAGIVMIVLGLAAFAVTVLLVVYSAQSMEIFEASEEQFYFYTAVAGGAILSIMGGVLFVSIPSKDGTMSAVTIALGSILSVTLGVLFAVILVVVFIIAMIIAFLNACFNMCEVNSP